MKPGKGAAFVRSKLRNYVTGNTVERTFRAGEQVCGTDCAQIVHAPCALHCCYSAVLQHRECTANHARLRGGSADAVAICCLYV